MTSSGAVLYFLSQLGMHRMVCSIAKMQFKNVGYIITTFEFTEVEFGNLESNTLYVLLLRKQYTKWPLDVSSDLKRQSFVN